MAEKSILLIDGQPLEGLVNISEINLEQSEIEVPEFHKKRRIKDGVTKIPALDLTFKLSRNSKTRQVLKDWFMKDETHDLVKIRTDATGIEFARTILPSGECSLYNEPAYDAGNVSYAQMKCRILVWDIIPL